MFKRLFWSVGIVLIIGGMIKADIVVHDPNFVVDTLLDQIDEQTPRLEAISNADYGFGIVAAWVDKGILKVFKISQSSVALLATESGFPSESRIQSVRFDTTGLFNYELYISVVHTLHTYYDATTFLKVSAEGDVTQLFLIGDGRENSLGFIFDFTAGDGGYVPGAYLEDTIGAGGTSLYHMDTDFFLTKLSQDCLPPTRIDLDIWGMQFDPTGLYGSRLTLADSDLNDDKEAVIYYLLPDTSWVELTDVSHTNDRYYRDICFSQGGTFGKMLYATERRTEKVMSVDPNGVHMEFASGFSGLESITVSKDGNHMFLSDVNGIYRIRAGTTDVGPTIVMREPWVEGDDVHTGDSGVDSLQILWSERVIFDNNDISIVNEDYGVVPFSVSGSNSAFMIIVFGESLLNDRYTITINDTVISVEAGKAIDGDNDGLAGGAAVLVMEHRKRHDSENDNDLDFSDFRKFAEEWLWNE